MQSLNVFEKGIGYLEACLEYYTGSSAYLMLYLVALIYICIAGTKKEREIFVPASVFLIVTVYNPVAPVVLDRFFDVNSEYYRFFWITPVVVLIPYLFTKLILTRKSKNKTIVVSVLLVIICVLSGRFLYSNGVTFAQNIYKMPNELMEISGIIHSDSGVEYPKALLEYEYNMQMRQYDPKMLLTIDREDYMYAVSNSYSDEMLNDEAHPQYRLLAAIVRNQNVDEQDFLNSLEQTKTEYVVLNKNSSRVDYLEKAGLKNIGETENHVVYRYELIEPYEFELVDYSVVY